MASREQIVKLAKEIMHDRERIRNIGIVAHIDHGKTTLTDNLIAAAGLISEELAGKQLVMDFYELEQQRGITINSANISLVHPYEGKKYLVNIIDTPGHIDFGGEVVRAMRAVDGVVLVVDAVEGVMPQTETVIRQALREYVKPVLFINKVDRLINEIKIGPEEMQKRFVKVITDVNNLIRKYAPKEFKESWLVNVNDGSVAFGSAYNNWAVSVPQMKKRNVTFKDVYEHLQNQDQRGLAKKSPLHEVVLDMVIKHLPNPIEAQKYRIPNIWRGDLNTEEGKAMLSCDKNGPLAMMITDVSVDPHAGDVATGRIYSGTVRKGMTIKLVGSNKETKVQIVALYMGPERIPLEEVPAGNIAAIIGLKEAYAGQTVASKEIEPFESFKSKMEPVITISVEAKNPKDLPKLIEVLKQITKENPEIRIEINQETGEHLVSAMGELQLEVVQYRIKNDYGLDITVSPPIVVYQETITKQGPVLEGKSPNKHNKFKLVVEPLPKEFYEKLKEEGIDLKIKEKDKWVVEKLIELGLPKEEARNTWAVHLGNIFVNKTRGIPYLSETKELVVQAFWEAVEQGPLALEKVTGIKVSLVDATLHEDAIHRGPAQVYPAIKKPIYAGMLMANPILLEPTQKLTITVPQDYLGNVSKELNARRAQIREMRMEGDEAIIIAVAPVKELIGFSPAIRSATQGKAIWTAEFEGFVPLPRDLQQKVIREIRERKGLPPEPRKPEEYLE